MKRFLLFCVVVGLFAGQASAAMYVMDTATAIDLRDVTYYNSTINSSLDWVGYNDGTAFPNVQTGNRQYGGGNYDRGMYYQVGFVGFLEDNSSGTPYPSVDIGAAANTNNVLTALQGLGSFGSYGLNIANDNDDNWEYKLYAVIGGTRYDSTSWTSLASYSQTFLTLSFGSDLAFGVDPNPGVWSGLTDIGFTIQSKRPDKDFYHTSVAVPVPAAVILGILGLGVVGVKLRKYA